MQDRNGYEADSEEDVRGRDKVKASFQTIIETLSAHRRSHADVTKGCRRLDAMARLLEADSICAAVYYDHINRELWFATNKVHGQSHQENKKITYLKSILKLISDESLTLKEVAQHLAEVITLNIKQQERFKVNKFKAVDVKKVVEETLNSALGSQLASKKWRANECKILDENYCEEREVKEAIIERVARLARDFNKVRQFVLYDPFVDELGEGIRQAIRGKKFKILQKENSDVHAEMRILSEIPAANRHGVYIGISKLCCDHCHLVLTNFNVKSRGVHGQRADWKIPTFIHSTARDKALFLGEAYDEYQKLSPTGQQIVHTFIESKECNTRNEDKRHGRRMEADSSDSDTNFDACGGEDELEILKKEAFIFDNLNKWRLLKRSHAMNCQRLREIGLTSIEIYDLYFNELKSSTTDFDCLSNQTLIMLIQQMAKNEELDADTKDIFYQFKHLFFTQPELFELVLQGPKKPLLSLGLEIVCQRFRASKQSYQRTEEYALDDQALYNDATNRLMRG